MSNKGFYVSFKVPELQQALDQIGAYDGKSRMGIEAAVRASTKAIDVGSKRRVRVATGRLKKKIGWRFNTKTVTGTVAARSPHAHLLEFGAKAAIEVPDTKKAMAIDAFGYRRFAKKAHIPVRAAHPFMRPSFEDEKPNLIRAVAEVVKKP